MNHSEFHPNRTTGKRLKKVSGGRGRISENVEVFAVQWHAVTSKCPKCWGFCLQWQAVTSKCLKCQGFCLQWHAVTSKCAKCWGFCGNDMQWLQNVSNVEVLGVQWHTVTLQWIAVTICRLLPSPNHGRRISLGNNYFADCSATHWPSWEASHEASRICLELLLLLLVLRFKSGRPIFRPTCFRPILT